MPRHPVNASKSQLKIQTIAAFQRHLDSQLETAGIVVSENWCTQYFQFSRLVIQMVVTTERGRKVLAAIEERLVYHEWLKSTHENWKTCLDNGDIKDLLARKEVKVLPRQTKAARMRATKATQRAMTEELTDHEDEPEIKVENYDGNAQRNAVRGNRTHDMEAQRVELAHQDAQGITDAVRTMGSEVTAAMIGNLGTPVGTEMTGIEARLAAVEEGQRRLEGMMLEILSHARK